MVRDIETVIVGAGVIGLAIARQLALSGNEVLIVEKNQSIGEETSSRNSEVIHAGIYYKKNSLKSQLCLDGKQQLYQYCDQNSIPHKRTGKLIVATDESELEVLKEIKKLAHYNGVKDLKLIDRNTVNEIEPELDVAGALESPSTGVVDTHNLMHSLLSDAENNGAVIALNSPLIGGVSLPEGGMKLSFGGDSPTTLSAGKVVVAAGLWSQRVAMDLGIDRSTIPELNLVKGNYFSLSTSTKFNQLIYPIPSHGGLGIHMTIDLADQVKFGPDSEHIQSCDPAKVNYDVDPERSIEFYKAIRKYWPGLPDGALKPDYAGVRPKLSMKAAHDIDFCIHDSSDHGCVDLICLYGIESPGLTACLAIAHEVDKKVNNLVGF